MIVSNVKIYGFDDSVKASKYPKSVDISTLTSELTGTAVKLGQCKKGTGHDTWLNGVIVQFDLTFTIKAWTQAERYHFFEFVSSQSTMHKITEFDLDNAYIEYVDRRIIDIMKELVENYNNDPTSENRLCILYSNPCGMRLTARMSTNYRQLKTMYSQRKSHDIPEWREFCEWIESLPDSEIITGEQKNG
jgi:hypothetical protein